MPLEQRDKGSLEALGMVGDKLFGILRDYLIEHRCWRRIDRNKKLSGHVGNQGCQQRLTFDMKDFTPDEGHYLF